MLYRRRLTGSAVVVVAALATSGYRVAAQEALSTHADLPQTTTLERLVNPTGLSEPSPMGWHTDYIGPLRGVLDASFGVKFWPDRFYVRDLMMGGAIDLAPGVRARVRI